MTPPVQGQPGTPPAPGQAAQPPAGAAQPRPQPSPQQQAAAAKQIAQVAEQKTAPATAQAEGSMSMPQLAALVMKANRWTPQQIASNPQVARAFAITMERMQKFLTADGKQALTEQKMQLEYQAKSAALDQKYAQMVQTAKTTDEKFALQQQLLEEKMNTLLAIQGQKDKAAGERNTEANTTKKDIATDTNQTKKDVAAINATSKEKIAASVAQAKKDLAAGNQPSEQDMKNIAEARSYGDASVMNLGWGATTRVKIMAMAAQMAKDRGTTIEAADAGYHGELAATSQIGRISAAPAVGGSEVTQTLPLAVQAMKTLGQTNYPNVNAVRNAVKARTGSPEQQAALAQLNQYITAMQSAYRLVIQRGGSGAVHYQEQAEKLINGSLSIPALIADGQAIQKEAGIVGKATSNAMRGATGGGEATAPDQGGDASSMSDEELKKKLGIQ